ncbi:hypothetical protein AQ505_23140 [Pedobacter sp. PACM 27299]|uniref:hypothetical protein n=1 Tax=Pedobacter sp. PACM 27299 TaxID=1727164 RepID=UPI000706BBB2|nr:hypothetical protein [Pedobacter sp. PACM 27299]ALL08117.1 hypothetical protein AQ505_23140 [Pedobacter sp. PACM 27299]
MSTEKKDKLHPTDLGETKDFDNLSYDKDKNSFVFDVKGEEKDYDHPLPYDTSAPNGEDSSSSYDEANPYIGSEYNDEEQIGENLEEAGMHIDNGEIVVLAPEDELLARTAEDERKDLDEEGYPINDTPEPSRKTKGLRQG